MGTNLELEEKEMKPKVSIIIPVYGVEKYIRRCLESVINQSEREIEIIVVNDNSPDGSEEIVKEYEKKDKRIRYIKHEVNKKQGGARNTGMEVAKGEYIWFIDSDDYVDIYAVETLYRTAKKSDLDALFFELVRVSDEGMIANYHYGSLGNRASTGKVMTGKELFNFRIEHKGYSSSPCCMFVKSSLAKKYKFIEKAIYEDADWTIKMYLYSDRVMHIRYAPYYYYVNPTSTMSASYGDEVLASVNHLKLYIRLVNLTKKESKENQICLNTMIIDSYKSWGPRIEKNKDNPAVEDDYQLFVAEYELFTGKKFDLNKLEVSSNKPAVSPLPSPPKQLTSTETRLEIKKLRKKYWEMKKVVWTRDWIKIRDKMRFWKKK